VYVFGVFVCGVSEGCLCACGAYLFVVFLCVVLVCGVSVWC